MAAAAGGRALVLCLLLVSFIILLVLRGHPIGLKEIAFWAGRIILILALVTFLVSVVAPYFSTVRLSSYSPTVSPDEMARHQEIVRKGQQELLSKKATEYNENIVKPRQEMKLKRKEEQLYKMTGQTWKLTEGQRLGEAEENENHYVDMENGMETANKEAIRKRKLPEQITKPLTKDEQPQPKKVVTLPEEPDPLDNGVVTIALRCPSGRVYRRRFYKSCSSHVLLDWMMKIGYHSVLYTISTSVPRCQLELNNDLTLENIGITRHTVLNIEEKDPS
ncbi:UBX domain-containing protein 8 isoform X1 [Pseudophryne corroboree]|uniref:UBX domain-containing protein 8 isoform X1 n=1 Tax=Pseudophryne corroboree TaxID=495146 RepID=UPI0030815B40